MKRFSPVRDTQRGLQLHEKEEREEGDRDEQEEEKGGLKRKETDLHSSLFPVFSIAQTPTEIHRIGLGREGERRKQRCSEVENGESKLGESNQHTPE